MDAAYSSRAAHAVDHTTTQVNLNQQRMEPNSKASSYSIMPAAIRMLNHRLPRDHDSKIYALIYHLFPVQSGRRVQYGKTVTHPLRRRCLGVGFVYWTPANDFGLVEIGKYVCGFAVLPRAECVAME